MQEPFKDNWNEAVRIWQQKQDIPEKNLPILSNIGNCTGLSYQFLVHALQLQDLEGFFGYYCFIAEGPPNKIASILISNSRLAEKLFRFVTSVKHLQDQEVKRTMCSGSDMPLLAFNALRIGSDNNAEIDTVFIKDQTTAMQVLEKLNPNEGLTLGGELHQYAVARIGDNTWRVFDSNAKKNEVNKEYSNISGASKYLSARIKRHLEILIAYNTKNPLLRTGKLWWQSIKATLPESFSDHTMKEGVPLTTVLVKFSKAELTDPSQKTEKRKDKHEKTYKKLMTTLSDNNAELYANLAVATDRVDLLKTLINSKKLDINKQWPISRFDTIRCRPPLVNAANYNSYDIAKYLLDNGAILNLVLHYGCTVFEHIVIVGHHRITQLCIDHGAELNTINPLGFTPIFTAIEHHDYDTTHVLVEAGADINIVVNPIQAQDPNVKVTPLSFSLDKDEIIAELLLENGADYNFEIGEGRTLFNSIVLLGNPKLTRLCIEREVDLNARNTIDGKTPIFDAVAAGDCETITLMLGKGVDVDVTDDDGITPLHHAVALGKESVVKLLLAKNANPDLEDNNGDTPKALAEEPGSESLLALFNRSDKEEPVSKQEIDPMRI